MVFGTKTVCPQCGASKGQEGLTAVSGNTTSQMKLQYPSFQEAPGTAPDIFSTPFSGGGATCREGDWHCPNAGCVNSTNLVFGRNDACPRCGTPKPGDKPGAKATAAVAALQYLPLPKSMSPLDITAFNLATTMMAHLNSQPGLNGRPGDWQCPNRECVNHKRMVFAKNEMCPQCGASKPSPVGLKAGNPHDWQCPNSECQNHRNYVFAKHEMCPRCGTSKDQSLRKRSRSPSRYAAHPWTS
mmetsp:Transcript_12830/g.14995  ORF Transcript_12830/g.14995 Transcript_12830/m.14995 type:complete len:242 (-) Transcript_12830:116-841(-)